MARAYATTSIACNGVTYELAVPVDGVGLIQLSAYPVGLPSSRRRTLIFVKPEEDARIEVLAGRRDGD